MIKYKDTFVVFEEIPDRISLAINITNCQNRCIGCHSPELRCDIGNKLTNAEMDRLIKENYGVNCVVFMGEGNDHNALIGVANYVKTAYGLDVALYSGREDVEGDIYHVFDFIKVGPYKEECGPLNKETTNQRLYEMVYEGSDRVKKDITYKFWKRR